MSCRLRLPLSILRLLLIFPRKDVRGQSRRPKKKSPVLSFVSHAGEGHVNTI